MPQIKGQIKTVRKDNEKKAINASRKSECRNAIKKAELLIDEGKKEEAVIAVRHATSLLDKLAQDGIISENSCKRKKAHLAHRVNALA